MTNPMFSWVSSWGPKQLPIQENADILVGCSFGALHYFELSKKVGCWSLQTYLLTTKSLLFFWGSVRSVSMHPGHQGFQGEEDGPDPLACSQVLACYGLTDLKTKSSHPFKRDKKCTISLHSTSKGLQNKYGMSPKKRTLLQAKSTKKTVQHAHCRTICVLKNNTKPLINTICVQKQNTKHLRTPQKKPNALPHPKQTAGSPHGWLFR